MAGQQPPTAMVAPTLFGAPTTTTSAAPTLFGFGSPMPTTSIAPSLFGTQTATVAPIQFGAPGGTTAAPTVQFGAPMTQTTPTVQFGAPTAQATPTVQFGAPITQTTPTVQFGAPSSTTTPAVAPTLFGTPTTTTTATGLFGFGTPTLTTSQTPATSIQSSTPGAGLTLTGGLGQPNTTSSGIGTLPTFGIQPTTTLGGLGGQLQTPATTTATAPGLFGFGTSTLATTQTGAVGQPNTLTSSGIGTVPTFGIQPTTTLGGLGGYIPTQQFQTPSSLAQGVGVTAYTGLGGTPSQATTDSTFTLTNTTTNGIKPEHRTVKDQPLPTELLVLVEELKNHVKSERIKLTEISAVSEKATDRVSEYCDEIRQSVANVSNVQHRQMLNLDAIRQMINQDIRDAETAQLIRDTPISLQQNYQFPIQYLFRTIKDFEDKMVVYQREIAKSEAALHAGATGPLNAKELYLALKASRDVLVVLAAKVKTLHDKVAHEIETHQNLLQFVHGDTAKDIFSDRQRTPAQVYMPSRHRGLPFPDQYRTPDPAKTYMSYLAASKVGPSGGYPQQLRQNKPYEPLPYNMTGSGGQSTFYHSHQSPTHSAGPSMPSQSVSPGISLKRTKH